MLKKKTTSFHYVVVVLLLSYHLLSVISIMLYKPISLNSYQQIQKLLNGHCFGVSYLCVYGKITYTPVIRDHWRLKLATEGCWQKNDHLLPLSCQFARSIMSKYILQIYRNTKKTNQPLPPRMVPKSEF